MILIESNQELKEIFTRLVKKMGISTTWNGIFAVENNSMILVGEPYSMVFNYENKRVYPDIFEINQNVEIEQMPGAPLFTNLFNMTLYAFSKWGALKGIKVEKDYGQLDNLFQGILKEIKLESSYSSSGFHFYNQGIQITYEDVIDIAVESLKEEEIEDADGEHSLGLWHNVQWKVNKCVFEKLIESNKDVSNKRIGNNFYPIDYICPSCKERLFMTTYKENEDVLIETEEARVYMARAYACNACNVFYTPKPDMLLSDGEVYYLEFEDDKIAYEDYLERLGKNGIKNASFRFNEYETKKGEENQNEINTDLDEEGSNNSETKSEQRIDNYKDSKMTKGIKGNKDSTIKTANTLSLNAKTDDADKSPQNAEKKELKMQKKYNLSTKTIDELKAAIIRIEKERSNPEYELISKGAKETSNQEYFEALKEQLSDKIKAKYEARLKISSRMTNKQLAELRKKIEKENDIPKEEVKEYLKQIDQVIYKNEKELISNKAEKVKDRSYADITRVMNEIEQGEGLEDIRKELVASLMVIRKERGREEIEQISAGIPTTVNRKQYEAYLDKIKQYEEDDVADFKKRLQEILNMTEEEKEFIPESKDKKTIKSLKSIDRSINFKENEKINEIKPLGKEYHKAYEKDKAAIERICPNIMQLSFEEGLEAYEKISEGVFLPELKDNTLKMIRKRLRKLKTDENIQLVKKLKRELEREVKDFSGIHFYEAEEYWNQDSEKEESMDKVIANALDAYGTNRHEFEYPLLVCDSSGKGTGKKGFILTPDHIFHKDFMDNGRINVKDIETIEYKEGKITKKICASLLRGEIKNLPNKIKQSEKKAFILVLDSFVKYLKEKPESRDIGYLAKEEHTIKCCYRCGHRYKGGNICPKCGNKGND